MMPQMGKKADGMNDSSGDLSLVKNHAKPINGVSVGTAMDVDQIHESDEIKPKKIEVDDDDNAFKLSLKQANSLAKRAGVAQIIKPTRLRGMAGVGRFAFECGAAHLGRGYVILGAEGLRKVVDQADKMSRSKLVDPEIQAAMIQAKLDAISKLISCGDMLIRSEDKSPSANGNTAPVTPSAPPRVNVTIQNLQQSPK